MVFGCMLPNCALVLLLRCVGAAMLMAVKKRGGAIGTPVAVQEAAFGRRRSADAANREAYEEYSRHYCSGDGGHAGGRART